MKKYVKYIIVLVILLAGYIGTGKILDRVYLSKFDIVDYTGQTRYSTVNSVIDKKYKKADQCFLVNTDYLAQGISLSPYAYNKDIPIFYVKKNEIPQEVYKQMEKLGIKKAILIGGVNYISNAVVRSLGRSNIKSDRIVASEGINFSLMMANRMNEMKKVKEIAVVTDDELDLPNGITFIPYADRHNIPIFVIKNDDKNMELVEEFATKNNIQKTYLIGINNYYNTNIEKTLPGVVRIAGKDRFEIDRNIMDRFFKDKSNKKVYISKGGEVVHKRHLAPGQLINALSITVLAADNNAPVMYIENNYFKNDEARVIKEKGYHQINEVGFKIERRNFFNVERFKEFTTILLIIIVLLMIIRVILFDKKPYKIVKIK